MSWRQLSSAAGIILSARLMGAAAVVISLYVLTHTLAASQVGIVIAVQAIAVIAASFGTLNMEGVAIRILPQRKDYGAGLLAAYLAAIGRTCLWAMPLAVMMAVIVSLFSTGISIAHPSALLAIAFTVPAVAFLRVASQIAQGLGLVRSAAWCPLALRPIIFIIFILIMVRLDMVSLAGILTLSAVSFLIAGLIQSLIIWRHPESKSSGDLIAENHTRAWQRTGLVLMLSVLMVDRFPDIVTLLSTFVLPEVDIAILAIALRFALILRMLTMAVNMSIGPSISAALGRGDLATVKKLSAWSVRLNMAAGSLLGIVLCLIAKPLLAAFGAEYIAGENLLRALVFLTIIPAFFGPSLLVLTASGETKAILISTLIGLGGLIIAVQIGALAGVMGVAWGIVFGQSVWSIALFIAVQRRVQLTLWLPATNGPKGR